MNGCHGATPPLTNPVTRYIPRHLFGSSIYICPLIRPCLCISFSSSSPCSSGYATPQQTALTDSMVDTLAWKNLNIKDNVRNAMEDSTDTLTDMLTHDGDRVSIFFPLFSSF